MANNGLRVGSRVKVKVGRGEFTGKVANFLDDGKVIAVKLDKDGEVLVRRASLVARVERV